MQREKDELPQHGDMTPFMHTTATKGVKIYTKPDCIKVFVCHIFCLEPYIITADTKYGIIDYVQDSSWQWNGENSLFVPVQWPCPKAPGFHN